jgi:uncharacterized membrane protein YkvA (DUF1232 family)
MESFFGAVRFFMGCGTLLVLAMVVLAHLPKSPLKTLLTQVCGWMGAALCGAYTLSPIDVMPEIVLGPFGLPDDVLAVIVGIMSARAARKAGKDEAVPDRERQEAA